MDNLRQLPQPEGSPLVEPVTLEEAKAHLRVDGGDEDGLIASLVTAARQAAEAFTQRIFTAATFELRVDAFGSMVALPVAPVGALVGISYLDAAGQLQTLAPGAYYFDDHPDAPALLAQPSAVFPAVLPMPGAVRIRFSGGYSAANPVPRAVVQAMLLTVGHLHANREEVLTGASAIELPLGTRVLLWPYRRGLGV